MKAEACRLTRPDILCGTGGGTLCCDLVDTLCWGGVSGTLCMLWRSKDLWLVNITWFSDENGWRITTDADWSVICCHVFGSLIGTAVRRDWAVMCCHVRGNVLDRRRYVHGCRDGCIGHFPGPVVGRGEQNRSAINPMQDL